MGQGKKPVKVRFGPRFSRHAKPLVKKYRSLADDLGVLEAELIANPESGDMLMPNVYKVRMSIGSKNSGKSGGARVITYVYVDRPPDTDICTVYLLTIYDKADRERIAKDEIQALVQELLHQLDLPDA